MLSVRRRGERDAQRNVRVISRGEKIIDLVGAFRGVIGVVVGPQ